MECSRFFCTKCGYEGIPLPRKMGNRRETGHLKDLYCPHCQENTNHCEIKPEGYYTVENFYYDFINGKFNENTRSN